MPAQSTLRTIAARSPSGAMAAVFEAPQRVKLRPMEWIEPQPNQVRVALEGCGICGSNLPLWEGRPWFTYPNSPGAPGHEGWGIIDAVGQDVHELNIGDRVAVLSYCAFASHDVATTDRIVRLPSMLHGRPWPGEAIGCAMNVFHRSAIQPAERVAVVGVGFLGALLIQLADSAGAHVIAISRRQFSLDVAARCGAHECIQSDDTTQIAQGVGDGGCDCAIEAAGAAETLELASRLVRTRGRLVIAGYHQDGPRTVDMQSWNWRGIDVINAHERDVAQYVRGMHEAVAAAAEGRIQLESLLTHEFSLAEMNEAFRVATSRPAGFVKAWINCRKN